MNNWSVEKIQAFYKNLNEHFGLSVNPEIEIGESNKFPLQWHKGKLLFIPAFFNDEEIEDNVRINLLLIMYSGFYHSKYNDNHVGVHPMFLVKGICSELGYQFLSDSEIESNLRKVRRRLYTEIDNACYFKVGLELRESSLIRYEVTKIERTKDDILITVKTIGCNNDNTEKVFTEEELYNRACVYEAIDNINVCMNKNLVVISGPSGAGKTTVLKEVMKQCSELEKTVSVTTRKPRKNEVEGKDYYFISKDEFYDYQLNNKLLDNVFYDGEYYGILYSEIDKYPRNKPLALVVDVSGRRSVLRHYPLSTTIFVEAPSIEELRKRIELRGENSEDEIEERMEIALEELLERKYYDHIVVNKDVKQCADEIIKIIKNLNKEI